MPSGATDRRSRGRRASTRTASAALPAASALAGQIGLALVLAFLVALLMLLHEPAHRRNQEQLRTIQELLRTLRGHDEPDSDDPPEDPDARDE